MGRCSPDPRRHESFLRTVRERLTEKLGPSGAGVTEVVVQMCAHTSSLRPTAAAVHERCTKLLRFLEPIDFTAWAQQTAGALSKARSHTAPQSPDWPASKRSRRRMNLQMRCSGLPPVISRWSKRMQSVMTHFQWSLIRRRRFRCHGIHGCFCR